MKKRILVVDDQPTITLVARGNLEQTGLYEVRTVRHGALALQEVRDFRPDLILLDVMMPGLTGPEIAEQLREDPELSQIKIVFLTSVLTKEEERAAGGHIGGQTFIAKPFRGEELLRVIAEQLQD